MAIFNPSVREMPSLIDSGSTLATSGGKVNEKNTEDLVERIDVLSGVSLAKDT